MKLHYAGTPGEGFGWGVCNTNLRREIGKLCELVDVHGEIGWDGRRPVMRTIEPIPDVVFMPLADHDFAPATPARGKINLAYTFFESPLGPNAAENAKKYDVVFCGSTWCLERMKEAGITNGEVLIQGVDHSIFKPGFRMGDNQFRVFSGGKFEYRKGQDLVIAAFAEFAKTEPTAHLVCAWFNPWPQLIYSMWNSRHIVFEAEGKTQMEFMSSLLRRNGVENFTVLPQLTQRELASQMQNTDCGLFPNRCEGGTNLVLMEYAACGRPVVANALTGHADVREAIAVEIKAKPGPDGWAKQNIGDIVAALHSAKSALPRKAEWTWERAARQIIDRIETLTLAPSRE